MDRGPASSPEPAVAALQCPPLVAGALVVPTEGGMVTRPRLLDLFCGAGGAAVGYHRAGFEVVGVDINPQPHYPFEFHQGDALEILELDPFVNPWVNGFHAIHASPPCQSETTMSNRHRGNGGLADQRIDWLTPTLAQLRTMDIPWVVENVPGARPKMRHPLTLHGGMFGLGVQRPRLFESNVLLLGTRAPTVDDPIGVYGKAHDGRRLFDRADGTTQYAAGSLSEAQAAMGIDWMTWDEVREAIPPAYTEWIGEQLLAHLEAGGMTAATQAGYRTAITGGVNQCP